MRRHLPLLAAVAVLSAGCPFFLFDRDEPPHQHDTAEPLPDDPNEPGDACEDRLDGCLASGRDARSCQAEYDVCVGQGDPGVPPEGDCRSRFQECVASGVEPEVCDAELRACLGNTDPGTACDRLLATCHDLGLPDDYCASQFDDCVAATTPDPCETLAQQCLDLGLEPAYCREQYAECVALGETDVPVDGDPATGQP